MKKAFYNSAHLAWHFEFLRLNSDLDWAFGGVLNMEFASAWLCVLVSDTLDLSSECFLGHRQVRV